MNNYLLAIIQSDKAPVVACDLNHIVVFMNKSAIIKYHGDLTGKSLLECHSEDSNSKIKRVVEYFKKDKENNIVYTFHNDKENRDVYMVALRDENENLIGYYEKHEYRDKETRERYEGV